MDEMTLSELRDWFSAFLRLENYLHWLDAHSEVVLGVEDQVGAVFSRRKPDCLEILDYVCNETLHLHDGDRPSDTAVGTYGWLARPETYCNWHVPIFQLKNASLFLIISGFEYHLSGTNSSARS